MEDEIVYFKLKMLRSKRNKVKAKAAEKNMTMQDFIVDCVDICSKKE